MGESKVEVKNHRNENAFSSYILEQDEEKFEVWIAKKKDYTSLKLRRYTYSSKKVKHYLPFIKKANELALEKRKEWNSEAIILEYSSLTEKSEDKEEVLSFLNTIYQPLHKGLLFQKGFFGKIEENRHSKDFIYFIEKGELYKTLSIVSIVESVIESKMEKEPTIELEKGNIRESHIYYRLYYEGKYNNLSIKREKYKKEIHVTFKDEITVISLDEYEEDDWLKIWGKIFLSDYNKTRLNAIFKPPTRYQEKNIKLLADKKKQQEQILNYLKEKYHPREMENLFARSEKEQTIGKEYEDIGYDDKIAFAYIENHIFVYNDEVLNREKVKHFTLEEKDQALEYYQQLFETYYENLIKRKINYADSKAKRIEKRLAKG